MKRILRHIPSLLLATCFVVSGWLKGVDLYATVFETVKENYGMEVFLFLVL